MTSAEKPELHVVSFSGGKDSTAMLLGMKERGMQIDRVIYCDTTVEFPTMHDHIKAVEDYIGIPITILKADYSFEYMLLEHPLKTDKIHATGYSFPGPRTRWCTSRLKMDVINRYLRGLRDRRVTGKRLYYRNILYKTLAVLLPSLQPVGVCVQ